jgi:putative DNA primase/helicase
MGDYNNIPDVIKNYGDVFCCHRNKVPTHGTRTNNKDTFFSFDQAMQLMMSDEGLGIGIFDNLCGVDIDHCVEDGVISNAAMAIVDYFNSYAELSMSGTGIHILFLCDEQFKDTDNYYTKLGIKQVKDKGIIGMEGLEIYQGQLDQRYLTLTGIEIHSMNVASVSGYKLKMFLDLFFKKNHSSFTKEIEFESSDVEDQAWIKWALFEKKPKKLLECWVKTPTGSGGTESEDDMSFMNELAFWCNHNVNVMKAVFESSRYFKAKDEEHKNKWLVRSDYAERTINKALAANSAAKIYYKNSYHYDDKENKIVEVK